MNSITTMTTALKDLSPGDTFSFEGTYYMLVFYAEEDSGENEYNAVDLEDGEMRSVPETTQVTKEHSLTLTSL